jgi:hypothetical protein
MMLPTQMMNWGFTVACPVFPWDRAKWDWYVLELTQDHSHPLKMQVLSTSLWDETRCLLKSVTVLKGVHNFTVWKTVLDSLQL